MRRSIVRATAAALLGLTAFVQAPGPAHAQQWPSKQVSVLLPTAAGGNTDLMARLACEHLAKTLGQPFVVINRPSAGGVITSTQVGEADPDGYTLLFTPSILVLLTPHIQKVQFDFDKALSPVTNVGTGVQVVAVRAGLPVKTLQEFIAHAKANPGKLNFAIAGANNISHLAPLLLFGRVGIELAMVATRGEPQAITELLAGNVDFYFGNAGILLGSDLTKIRLLAVGSAQRLSAAPELPAISELVPDFVFQSWNGFFVPAKTPDAIVDKLRATVAQFVGTPEMQKRLLNLGIIPGGQTKAQVAETFERDRRSYTEAARVAGLKKP